MFGFAGLSYRTSGFGEQREGFIPAGPALRSSQAVGMWRAKLQEQSLPRRK